MTYHDPIVTITLCRGEIAVAIGGNGLMVKSWPKLTKALEDELRRETIHRDDGHTGSSAVEELLIARILDRAPPLADVGLADKPTKEGSPNECWPEGQPWF